MIWDNLGKIISERQRDTKQKVKKDCQWQYLLSHKLFKGERRFINTALYQGHIHDIYLNPYSFKVHETSSLEYLNLVVTAQKYRDGGCSYADS